MVSTSKTWTLPGLTENGAEARILNAALRCFARHGLLRTSMADIATEAGLSRTSLYKHFASREEVFSALCRRVNVGVRRAVIEAAGIAGDFEERLHAVAVARISWAFDALHLSEYGYELIDAKNALCGAAEAETEFVGLLTRIIASAGKTTISPAEAAGLLAQCLPSLIAGERTEAAARKKVTRFLRVFAGGLLAR